MIAELNANGLFCSGVRMRHKFDNSPVGSLFIFSATRSYACFCARIKLGENQIRFYPGTPSLEFSVFLEKEALDPEASIYLHLVSQVTAVPNSSACETRRRLFPLEQAEWRRR